MFVTSTVAGGPPADAGTPSLCSQRPHTHTDVKGGKAKTGGNGKVTRMKEKSI